MSDAETEQADWLWHRMLLALVIGAGGGFVFRMLEMPLPWMLGAMGATMVAALARLPVVPPKPFGDPLRGTLGVMLGASFTPDLIEQASAYAVSLSILPVFVVAVAATGYLWLVRKQGIDPLTAYLSVMPGGLYSMMAIAEEKGADLRRVSLAHGLRIMLLVFTLPFIIQVMEGVSLGRPVDEFTIASDLFALPVIDALILLACLVLGLPLGRVLRLPGASLLGPLILSVIAHLSGLTTANVPGDVIVLVQIGLGALVGCRFVGTSLDFLKRQLVMSLVLYVMMMVLALGFAFGIAALTGQSQAALLLAYAPGGVAEKTLVALALGVDPAFVIIHHLARLILVIVGAPVLMRRFAGEKLTAERS
ncbi:MAG: AbrB family transcriptional regulator [Alphaproteobacteria bacterium]